MSDQTQGLKKALTAARQKNRELQQKLQNLTAIVRVSNMSGMLDLMELTQSYFGGIFERLAFKSQMLTAIAYSNYPDNSFASLVKTTQGFSPELAGLFEQYGINFAVVAPNDPDPAENKIWQLAYNFQGAKSNASHLRLYNLELFLDMPDQDLVERLYLAHREELEQAVQDFETQLIEEVRRCLNQKYNLTLENLEAIACLPC